MRALALIAVLIATASFAACGQSASSGSAPSQNADELRGRSFVSKAVSEGGRPRALVHDTQIRLSFSEEEGGDVVRWRAGCNDFGGDVEISTDRLAISRVVGTLIGCTGELPVQERWLANFFESDPGWQLEGDELSLTSGETEVRFQRTGAGP